MLAATFRRFLAPVGVCLLLAAGGAPAAAADGWWASTGDGTAAAVRPDDRPTPRGPGTAPDTRPIIVVERPAGFDWVDAGIGAGAAAGLIVLASGLSLVARRHRNAGIPGL